MRGTKTGVLLHERMSNWKWSDAQAVVSSWRIWGNVEKGCKMISRHRKPGVMDVLCDDIGERYTKGLSKGLTMEAAFVCLPCL